MPEMAICTHSFLYDRRIQGQEHDAEELSAEILRICVRAGGSITGEHGVGNDKKMFMSEMFAEPDLQTMQLVRCAFDPDHLSNPGKIFPAYSIVCGETGAVRSASARNFWRGTVFLSHAGIRKSYFGTSPGRTAHNRRGR